MSSENNARSGCSIIILTIIGIVVAYQHFVVDPKKKADEIRKQINFWGDSTVNFFDKFDCKDLIITDEQIKMEKFFVLFSYRDKKCKINEKVIKAFEQNSDIGQYYTRDIDSANVIVWLEIISGSKEGRYSNGAPAIRDNVELKLINKKSNSIFKRHVFETIGTARDEIRRKHSDNKPQHFGNIPYEKIIEFLILELNTAGNN